MGVVMLFFTPQWKWQPLAQQDWRVDKILRDFSQVINDVIDNLTANDYLSRNRAILFLYMMSI